MWPTMSQANLSKLLLMLLVTAPFTWAVPEGDENFDTQTSGYFYVFADKIIQIIDPFTMEVVKNITSDNNGNPLTNAGSVGSPTGQSRTWNDAVLIENPNLNTRQVFVNEGDIYEDASGDTFSYVTVLDAVTQAIVARQKVGALPVHMYEVNETSSAWSHSDTEGTFYVLTPTSSTNVSLTTTVPSYVTTQAHGKLVVNAALNPVSYGSNVGEQVLEKFNLTSATRTGHFVYGTSLSDPASCVGTHTIVYSQVNRHLYAECVDGAGTLEWNTVDDTFVSLLPSVGTLYNAPAGDMIFVTNTDNSTSTVLQPGGNGMSSTVLQYIQVPYEPEDPIFYSNTTSTTPASASSYTAFFPTLTLTNINDIRQATAANSSVNAPGYYGQNTAAITGQPVDCQYAKESNTSTTGLLLANGTNGVALTPSCGACAAGITPLDPSQYNASLAGVGVIDLASLSPMGGIINATLVPAGAAAPVLSLASDANQCSFAQVSRSIVRGGSFVALTADLPQSSIYVLQGTSPQSMYGRGFVATSDSPTTIVWVPSVEGVAPASGPAGAPSGAVTGG